jgi:hypothetical protein
MHCCLFLYFFLSSSRTSWPNLTHNGLIDAVVCLTVRAFLSSYFTTHLFGGQFPTLFPVDFPSIKKPVVTFKLSYIRRTTKRKRKSGNWLVIQRLVKNAPLAADDAFSRFYSIFNCHSGKKNAKCLLGGTVKARLENPSVMLFPICNAS